MACAIDRIEDGVRLSLGSNTWYSCDNRHDLVDILLNLLIGCHQFGVPNIECETIQVEGRTVVICSIPRSEKRPIYAVEDVKIDAQTGEVHHEGKRCAYIRIKDENIVASPVHLDIWKHERQERGSIVHYSEEDTRVVETLEKHNEALSLNRIVRLSGVQRFKVIKILSRLIRYDLAEWRFEEREFRFGIKNEE